MSSGCSGEWRRRFFAVLACVAIGFGMRAFHLRADPPPDLSPSGGYFADEGFWSHNARNKVLFGQWETDGWNDMWSAAPNHWLQYLTYSLVGVGLAQARVPALLLSVPLVLLCYCICRRYLPGYAWLAGAVLAGTDFLLVMFNRLALLETPTLVLLLGATALAAAATARNRASAVGAGCLMVLAVATKRTVVYAAPGLMVLVALTGKRRSVLWFFLGSVVTIMAWFLYARGHVSEVVAYHRYYGSQQLIDGSWLRQLVRQPLFRYFGFALPTLLLGLVGALRVWRRWLGGGAAPRPLEAACVVWLAAGVLHLGLLGYRPLRYYLPLSVPLVLLAAGWLGVVWSRPVPARWERSGLRFGVTWAGGMVLGVLLLGWAFGEFWPGWRRLGGGAALLGLGIALGAEVLDLAGRKAGMRARKTTAVALLTLTVLWNVKAYTGWAVGPTYAVYNACLNIAELPEGSVLTGQWSLELTLESTHRAVPVWKGFVNDVDPFHRYGITHAAVWDRHIDRFKAWYPEGFRDARVLRTYRIKESLVYLLELDAHRAPGRLVPAQEE